MMKEMVPFESWHARHPEATAKEAWAAALSVVAYYMNEAAFNKIPDAVKDTYIKTGTYTPEVEEALSKDFQKGKDNLAATKKQLIESGILDEEDFAD